MAFSDNWRTRKIQGGAILPVTVAEIAEPVAVSRIAEPVDVNVLGDLTLDPLSAVRFVDENGIAYGIERIGNKPRMSSMPYAYDIAAGNVPGKTAIHRYGHNADVGVAWETVHDVSTLRHYLATAERLQIASDDADDTAAGNGARSVMITGLDANLDPLVETRATNGAANVTTVASFLRVLQTNVITAGVTGYNEGTITVSNFADTIVLDQVEPMENESHCACYTVPNSHSCTVTQAMATEGSNKGSQFGFWMRPFGGLWTMKRTIVLLQSPFPLPMTLPMTLPAKTDFEIRVKGVLAGARVTAGFDGWIEAS